MKRVLLEREIKKVQAMIKSKKYCIMRSGDDLIGLIHTRTNEVYIPKFQLCVSD